MTEKNAVLEYYFLKSLDITVNDENCMNCPVKGDCCYASITIRDKNMILTNHPCKYLNLETKSCTVYEKRKELAPDCLSIGEALKKGALPRECVYAKHFLSKGLLPQYPFKERINPDDLKFHPRYLYDLYNEKPHDEIRNYGKKKKILQEEGLLDEDGKKIKP